MGDDLRSFFNQLVGEWEGMTRTWFEPDVLADESPTRGVFRPLLDGRFILHEYAGVLKGELFQGMTIYGYNVQRNKCQATWMDTAHMGTSMMHLEGEGKGRGFWLLGTYDDPNGGPPWGWRIVVELETENRLVITSYNINPQGRESKAIEIICNRID